jgi:hypothetical protein
MVSCARATRGLLRREGRRSVIVQRAHSRIDQAILWRRDRDECGMATS